MITVMIVLRVSLKDNQLKNVVVAKTSYQMLEALSFCDCRRACPPSIKRTLLTFLVKKTNKQTVNRNKQKKRTIYAAKLSWMSGF